MVRHLRDVHQADTMQCGPVAHHSHAIVEAEERGLADVLALELEAPPYVLSSVLTCCDMTTSPDGELVPADRRLAEIAETLDRRPVLRQVQHVQERPLGIRRPRQRDLPGQVLPDGHRTARAGHGRGIPR
jgi:hypothetical protein